MCVQTGVARVTLPRVVFWISCAGFFDDAFLVVAIALLDQCGGEVERSVLTNVLASLASERVKKSAIFDQRLRLISCRHRPIGTSGVQASIGSVALGEIKLL